MFQPQLSRATRIAGFLVPAALVLAGAAGANTVTNDLFPVGTSWGAGSEVPGDVIFVEDGIEVRVLEFFVGGVPFFGSCTITGPLPDFGSSRLMNTNNINNGFDLRELGADCVRVQWADFGGDENLSVNGVWPPIEVASLLAVDGVEVAPGVWAKILGFTAIPGGHKGVLQLDGPIETVALGGQEFWWDNLSTDCSDDPVDECDHGVTHEPLVVGDCFGTCAGHSPGDLAFSEDSIDTYLDKITYAGGGTGFNEARVDPTFAGFGDGNILQVNNIAIIWDLRRIDCPYKEVTFEFKDLGGTENFQVNGETLYIGELFTDVPPNPATDVTFSVSGSPDDAVVTLVGPIESILVAGQELWVDNLCVTCVEEPEPCENIVDHESRVLGEQWGDCRGTLPGDLWFVENGIPVYGARFDNGSFLTHDCATIESSLLGLGSGRVKNLANISARYDVAALDCEVREVTFSYLDLGGTENFQVNTSPLYVGEIDVLVPVEPSPGVFWSAVVTPVGGGKRVDVTLAGPVEHFTIGGQEFWIDDICVRCETAVGVDDHVHGPASLAELHASIANPYRPQGTIGFTVSEATEVRLSVYDVSGRKVATLADGVLAAGLHRVSWDGRSASGREVRSGTYFLQLVAGGTQESRKITLVR
jgi:hypothetical protein